MGKIFVGMIFVFLDFHITLNGGAQGGVFRIGLIPDFVGYAFMFSGLKELKNLSERFAKIMPFVVGMIVFSVIEYIMNLLGIGYTVTFMHALTMNDYIVLAFVIGLTVVSFFISYSIIMGIKDIEISKTVFLNSNALYLVWKLKVAFVIATFVLLMIPTFAIISVILGLGMKVCYLCFFYKTKRLFDQQRPQIFRESDHFDGGFRQFHESERQFEGDRNQFEEQNRQFDEQTAQRNNENDDVFGR